jgi:hypothetical protein
MHTEAEDELVASAYSMQLAEALQIGQDVRWIKALALLTGRRSSLTADRADQRGPPHRTPPRRPAPRKQRCNRLYHAADL